MTYCQGVKPKLGLDDNNPAERVRQFRYCWRPVHRCVKFSDETECRLLFETMDSAAQSWAMPILSATPDLTFKDFTELFCNESVRLVRSAGAEARHKLTCGEHAMRKGEQLRAYHHRLSSLFRNCSNMAMEDQIAWYLSGLTPALHTACCVNANGKAWTVLTELQDYALGQEARLHAQRQSQAQHTRLAAAIASHAATSKSVPHPTSRAAKRLRANEAAAAAAAAAEASPAAMDTDEGPSGGDGWLAVTHGKRQKVQSSGKGQGKGGKGQGKGNFAPRSKAWLGACYKQRLCLRCGKKGHSVSQCRMPPSAEQPSAMPSGAQ